MRVATGRITLGAVDPVAQGAGSSFGGDAGCRSDGAILRFVRVERTHRWVGGSQLATQVTLDPVHDRSGRGHLKSDG